MHSNELAQNSPGIIFEIGYLTLCKIWEGRWRRQSPGGPGVTNRGLGGVAIQATCRAILSIFPREVSGGHPEMPGEIEAEPWGGPKYPDFWSMRRSSVESFSPFLNRSKMSSASFFASTSSATSSVTPRLFIQMP